MSEYITQMNCAMSVNEMMLIEAKARQLYYSMFNKILEDEDFRFTQRSKQPPKDALNACISFGNTLLYNHFVSLIWKKGIDPRFGVVHASNRRSQSLNLDFADIFKPVIVDKIIFTLINKKMLTVNTDFEQVDSGGIYLTKEGKKIFIQAYEEKMNSKIVIKGKERSYRQVTEHEVQAYKNYLMKGEKYKPYKYY